MPPRAKPLVLEPLDTGPLDGKVIVLDPGHNGRNYQYIDVLRAEPSTTKRATPSTKPPTAKAPTAKAPTTKAPTAKAPTTKTPTTKTPTTKAPSTKPTTKPTARPSGPAPTTTTQPEREICNSAGSTTDSGVEESEIVWDITERIIAPLRLSGAKVVVTRPDNDGFGPCADERGKVALQFKADLFVSIHADGDGSGGSGYHLIYPGEKTNVSAEAEESSLEFSQHLNRRLRVAGLLPSNYTGEDGLKLRTNLANLNIANRTSVLAELGNLVHPKDAEMLSSDVGQTVIANAFVLAILDNFGFTYTDPTDLNGDDEIDVEPGMTLPTTTTTTTTTLPPETILIPLPTVVETTILYPPETVSTTQPPVTEPSTTQAPTTQPTTAPTTTSTTSTTTPLQPAAPAGP
jgi:N-acetylmuramoyl-L-alanine amidase